jgi:acetamidase/formamidase
LKSSFGPEIYPLIIEEESMKRTVIAVSLIALVFAIAVLYAQQPLVLRYTPQHAELKYTFGGAAPVRHIQSGTRTISWTEDCFDGAVKQPGQLPTKVMAPGHDNPQTGPFYVDGAEPGATLAIHIEKLDPAGPTGVSAFFPGFGALNGTDRTAMLGVELPETVWFFDVDRAHGIVKSRARDCKRPWEVPLEPFLGCLGVAPAGGEVRSSVVPDTFGGNMDCREVRAGNTVYLGVGMPSALLSFGDGHYAQGDGEIIGTAEEGTLNVELKVDLLKKRQTLIPRIESTDALMSVGVSRACPESRRSYPYKAETRYPPLQEWRKS